jgi:hypothetical protein
VYYYLRANRTEREDEPRAPKNVGCGVVASETSKSLHSMIMAEAYDLRAQS